MIDADHLLDPKEILFQYAEKWETEIRDAWATFTPQRTMFMPRVGTNWRSIQLFAANCDLFVGCDQILDWRAFCDSIEQSPLWAEGCGRRIQNDKIVGKVLPWLKDLHGDESERWVKLVKVMLPSDKCTSTQKWLLYARATLSEVYRAVFTERQQAPGFIYVRRPANMPDDLRQAFMGQEGELADAVMGNIHHRPAHIIIDIEEAGWL